MCEECGKFKKCVSESVHLISFSNDLMREINRQGILKEIQREVKELFGCDVDENTTLAEISADSLDLYEFIFRLEDRYDVNIPENSKSIGEVLNACLPR